VFHSSYQRERKKEEKGRRDATGKCTSHFTKAGRKRGFRVGQESSYLVCGNGGGEKKKKKETDSRWRLFTSFQGREKEEPWMALERKKKNAVHRSSVSPVPREGGAAVRLLVKKRSFCFVAQSSQ